MNPRGELSKKMGPPAASRPLSLSENRNRLTAHTCDVCFWHKADIARMSPNVRFWGKSGHCFDLPQCPLMTQSGHGRVRIAALSHCAKNTHLWTAHKGLTERFTELQYRWQ